MTSHNLTAREWNEDEGDISMEAEQLESSVLATKEQSAIRSTTDREGDVSMKEEGERPAGLGSAIVEQFAIRLENDGDDVHKALSPGISKMMEVNTPAQETATPLASSSEEDHDPARLQLATELGMDIVKRSNEWGLAGSTSARHLAKFQHQLSLAPSVARRLDMCQAFFDRMVEYHANITRARKNQQTAYSWTRRRMPRTVVAAHRHLVVEYRKVEAQVEEIIDSLKERAQALRTMDI
jgi:hypothetical protein